MIIVAKKLGQKIPMPWYQIIFDFITQVISLADEWRPSALIFPGNTRAALVWHGWGQNSQHQAVVDVIDGDDGLYLYTLPDSDPDDASDEEVKAILRAFLIDDFPGSFGDTPEPIRDEPAPEGPLELYEVTGHVSDTMIWHVRARSEEEAMRLVTYGEGEFIEVSADGDPVAEFAEMVDDPNSGDD